MPIFVKLNGIDGAIGSEREPATFEIKDFSFGVENPTTIDGDTFDFKAELTSEPTAPAGDGANDPAQMFQQIMQSGPPPDAFDFTSEPTTAADGSIPTETLSLNFDKVHVFDSDTDANRTEGFTSEPPAPEAIEGGWFIPLLATSDRSDPSGGVYYKEQDFPAGDVAVEKITLCHEGFELM